MSAVYTVQGYVEDKPFYRIEFTDSKKAALRGAEEILALNPGVDRVEVKKKRERNVMTIRRMG